MAIYIGVNGKARKVIGGYIGINGKAEIIYSGGDLPSGYVPYTYIYKNTYQAYITNYNSQSQTHPSYNTYTQVLCDFMIPSWHQGYEYLFYLDSKYWARIANKEGNNKFNLEIQKGSGSKFVKQDLDSGVLYSLNLTKDQDGSCYLNNELLFQNLDPTISSDRIIILGVSGTVSSTYNSGLRIKGLTGYDLLNKKYLFDFKPCNQTTSGIVSGVYDTVNKTFYSGGNSYASYFVCSNN